MPLRSASAACVCAAIGFNVETVQYKSLRFQVWDLGGQTSIRPYWRCYYQNTNAIIYVVDSADTERMGISKQELVTMLEEEELKDAVLMGFANKQDLPNAMTADVIAEKLGHCATVALAGLPPAVDEGVDSAELLEERRGVDNGHEVGEARDIAQARTRGLVLEGKRLGHGHWLGDARALHQNVIETVLGNERRDGRQ